MKKGLDFFPLDVDFFDDEKVQFVSARFGIKGEVCAIRLLTRIYRNGYFIKWDEDSAYLFSKVAGKEFSPCLANEIVHELVKRGFFNKSLFDSFGILTSRGIQDRFLKACIRRKDVEVDARYLLVDSSEFKNLRISKAYSSAPSFRKCIHDVSISEENVYIKEENVDIQAQSKVKKSRVEESKVKEKKTYSPSLPSVAEDIVTFLNSTVGSNYKSTTGKTRKLIAARLAEGFALEDFKTVISKKAKEWQGTDMAQYLRPETLFGTKFEGYLNQPEVRNNRRSPISRAEQERQEGIEVVNRLIAEYEEEERQNEQIGHNESHSTFTTSI